MEEGQLFAERMRIAIQNISSHAIDIDLKISASFGITSNEYQNSMKLEEMLRAADQALYKAKSSGRNCVCSYPIEVTA